jgi:hypothetical protein
MGMWMWSSSVKYVTSSNRLFAKIGSVQLPGAHMKRILFRCLVGSSLLLFTLIASAQTIPEQFRNPFHSQDEYELAHSLFDKISADLARAQSNYLADNAIFDRAQAELSVLEQNWDKGHYESRQIDATISALQMVLRDNRLMPQDLDALSDDLSKLLDFRTEYY